MKSIVSTHRARILLAASGVALLLACGGPQLDRLEGEPASTHPYTVPVTARVHPAVVGMQRFVGAMRQGAVDVAWGQLSEDTRKALQKRAAAAGVDGLEILRRGRMPVGDSMQGAVPFEPLVLFAVREIKTLQVLPPREGTTVVEQPIELTAATGAKRVVVMRFESFGWRIHHPDLKMPDPTAP